MSVAHLIVAHVLRVAHRPPSVYGKHAKREGSLLLEAIIAIGIFSLFLAGIGLTLVLGERSTIAGGDRSRAVFLGEQQLEALRQMSAQNFASLTAGQHGLSLGSGGWSFSGSSVLSNGFKTSVTLTSQGINSWQAASNVSWNFGNTRSGTILLVTDLTHWQKSATVGNWSAMTKIATVIPSGSPDFQSVVTEDSYAYLTGTNGSGGKGLYVYDVSNPADPVRVASSFDLGTSAYGLAIAGNRLYLATADPTKEVQVYDISSPATLSSDDLVNTYDLPGTGNARSIAVYGSNVFVGALHSPPHDEFSALLMSETGPMTLQSSLATSGSVLSMSLLDGYAYLGTGNNAIEMQVVDIFDAESVAYAPGIGADFSDVHDALALATSGTSALIGRAQGSTIDELILEDVSASPVPAPPPGPWTLEIGGDVNALAMIFGSKYAFVGGNASNAQLKVLDLVQFALGQAPVVRTYDASATLRGLSYNLTSDRLYGVTPSALLVFAPG